MEEQEFAESRTEQERNKAQGADEGDGFMNIQDDIDNELPFN